MTGDRYEDSHIYRAISDTIAEWGSRVTVPYLYTLSDGFTSNDFDYTLPDWVRPPIEVEWQETLPGLLPIQSGVDNLATQWVSAPSYSLEPDGLGGSVLRLELSPYTTPSRVLFHAPNGQLPSAPPVLGSSPDDDDTTLSVSGLPEIADVGYIKIDDEWMQYAGVSRSTDTVLQNLVRGLRGTSAASHTAGVTVYWGVALPEQQLLVPLYDGVQAKLHELYLTDSSIQDKTQHFDFARYYRQVAMEGLERRTRRGGKMVLHGAVRE